MKILAIDPGTEQSAFVLYDNATREILDKDIWENNLFIPYIQSRYHDHLVIEMIASYGMAVGKAVFETCVWIGRFIQADVDSGAEKYHSLVYRKDEKMFLCGNMKAKDANIRQALIDLIGPQGTKKNPGPTYGFSKDMWAALAVAITFEGMRLKNE